MNLEKMVIRYVKDDDATEDDYKALEDAINHTEIEMKPTSPRRRLLIAAKFYVEATEKAEIRRFFQEMEKEVSLLEALPS